uniref:Translation initiation factor eIF2B subunit epsilon n=1 Tax=Graphocephala atropunctata TaxID=36148 RepID=A0A1B6KND8_9HEMI
MYKTRGKGAIDTLDNENILQAVIIIDTFSQKLDPFCEHMASSLIPLVNRPLLEYTLECLFSAGVQEAILFCSSFAEQIRDFIREDRWPGLAISIVVSEGCRSLGDAMRDLDTKALIRSDFVLLTGNLVGNLQLLPALERHKRTQKADKGAVMTLIFKECGRRWKAPEDDFTVALDSKTNRILLYSKKSRSQGKINIPMETVLETAEIDLRSDLRDTEVSICSVAVPPLFSDNFDYQTKDDLVRGLLVLEEVVTNSLYCYLLPAREYAATVTSWAHYQEVTHDVIHRWTYPLVPDMCTDDPYFYRRNNIYIQPNVSQSQDCKLEEDVVLGKGTSVGQNSVISRSVVGRNCHIGNNVTIDSSFIMDNVIVQDGCQIAHSVVGHGATLCAGSSVCDGSLLGVGVVIDAGKHISQLRLQAYPSDDADPQAAIGSKAYLFNSISEDDSDSDSETKEVGTGLRVKKDEDHDDDDDDWDALSESDEELTRSLSPMLEDTNLFYNEVVDSLVRGYEDKLLCDNLVLEINSSRYAYNVTMSEVNYHVMRALLTLPRPDGAAWQQLASRLTYFMPILTNYIRSDAAQKDCLLAVEDIAGSHPEIMEVVMKIINFLYEKEILSEEAILYWYCNPCSETDIENGKRVRKQVAPFISWLEKAEEETSDDDDDEED